MTEEANRGDRKRKGVTIRDDKKDRESRSIDTIFGGREARMSFSLPLHFRGRGKSAESGCGPDTQRRWKMSKKRRPRPRAFCSRDTNRKLAAVALLPCPFALTHAYRAPPLASRISHRFLLARAGSFLRVSLCTPNIRAPLHRFSTHPPSPPFLTTARPQSPSSPPFPLLGGGGRGVERKTPIGYDLVHAEVTTNTRAQTSRRTYRTHSHVNT